MKSRNQLVVGLVLLCGLVATAYAIEKHNDRQTFMGSADFRGGIKVSGTPITAYTGSSVDTGSAGALAIGNTNATSVTMCNSAACDTATIGTNTDADTITIGESNDTVSLASANWSITGPGVVTGTSLLGPLDVASAGALAVGNTTATSVSVCNSAACDTLSLGTNTDADAITVGDPNDTTAINSALWSVSGAGIASFASVRVTNGTALTAANPTPSKATMQAASFFAVDTSSNAVDVDLPAMDAGDVGSMKKFAVTTGHVTQALTVTSGTLTVTTHNTLGTTCEDAQDHIDCLITAAATASCDTFCAD